MYFIYFSKDDDDDYEPEHGTKRKKGKKRKAKSDKNRKKKKRKKNGSGEDSDFLAPAEEDVGDSDYASTKKGRSKSKKEEKQSSKASSSSAADSSMPTVEEVCNTFDLADVDIDYSEEDFQNLTTYKMFQQHVRPILQKENPKVPMSKLMMLVAAKWRDFSESNPVQAEEANEEGKFLEHNCKKKKQTKYIQSSKSHCRITSTFT